WDWRRLRRCSTSATGRCRAARSRGERPMHVEDSRPVIEVKGLSRRFGTTAALESIDLAVPRGVVFGLLGENGAGKTTLIKHMLGLLRAQTGTVAVFGLDPVENPTGVLSRIGYLSEES